MCAAPPPHATGGDDGCDDGDDSGIADAALVVLQVLPAMTVGGVERGVVEVAKHLRARRVRGLVASADGPLVAQLEGVPHICLGLLRSKNPLNVLWRAPLALRRVIREHRVSVIHARSRTSAWSAWLASISKVVYIAIFT